MWTTLTLGSEGSPSPNKAGHKVISLQVDKASKPSWVMKGLRSMACPLCKSREGGKFPADPCRLGPGLVPGPALWVSFLRVDAGTQQCWPSLAMCF